MIPFRKYRTRGSAAVEFALVVLVFLVLVFGAVELARIMYMYNALADVTRAAARAAANIDWRNDTALNLAKRHAILRDTEGELPFGAPITDRHIRIDYMYVKLDGSALSLNPVTALPSCPGANRRNCLANPYGDGTRSDEACIRVVRARICKPGTDCVPEDYQQLLPLLNWNLKLPVSTTQVTAETLGYHAGDSVCG
jgi:hypothetical protein